MEPLICPQCGGQITSYEPGATFATCGYCATKFLIAQNKQSDVAPDLSPPVTSVSPRVISVIVVAVLVAVAFGLIAAMFGKKSPPTTGTTSRTPYATTPKPASGSAAAAPSNLLEFGGKGTGNGLFQDANSIAVDTKGRIYVSDDSMRVQQFDEKGQYLRTIQVPTKGRNYDKARTVEKIAVGDDGKLYVAVGGVLLVYADGASEFSKTIQVAPDYIEDFALKSDGGVLAVSTNDQIETLLYINKAGSISRRIRGFHTDALDAAISPRQTAVASIRIAVDGAGRIFSVYALGDLGSYSISSNNDELLIAHFNADGKFLNKFVQSMTSCGIAVDNQGRVYVSDSESIDAYNERGEPSGAVTSVGRATAFALDKDNNVYVLREDKVIKRPPIG
jgi:hypothetical protein